MKLNLLLIISFFIFSGKLSAQEKIYTSINEKGERIFSIKAKYVRPFYDGMAEVQKTVLENNKAFTRSGFIDATGKMVIEAKYEKVHSFNSGVAWVKEPGVVGYYLINKKGERLTTQTWEKVGYFSDGFCAVYSEEDKMGFMNRKGELIVPCNYLGDSFSEGLACVMIYDEQVANYGFMDTTGAMVIPLQYNQAGTSSFDNGECRVQINGVTCIINRKGEVVFKPTLTKNAQGFYDGLCASYTKSETRSGWGYYNRKNVWVIKPQYDNAESFYGGFAVVELGGKYGVIDTTGKIIIPIQYSMIFGNPKEDGYFGVQLEENGETKYLNAQGLPLTSVSVKYIYPSYGSSLLAFSNPDGKYGYLNLDGTLFMEAQFERTDPFYEGKAWVTGNASSLKIATGITEAAFVKEYVIGEKVKCKKNGTTEYVPGTVEQITEYYYLITFENGLQEWVVFDSLKR